MCGHIEAIARRKQHSAGGCPFAKTSRINSRSQPWKNSHPALRSYPVQRVPVLGKKLFQMHEVFTHSFARFRKNNFSQPRGMGREGLVNHRVRSSEITSCVYVLLDSGRVALHDPADAKAAQAK